jgi:hypothetical protein
VIAPVIIVICAIGAYTVHSSMFDVVLMLVFGVLGYLFKKLKYPLAPLVLALVLGDMAEASFRQAMLLSQGSLSIFWSNPLVGSITGLALVLLLWPLVGGRVLQVDQGRVKRRLRRSERHETDAMKIAVVGAGAIGGYLGARLALAGEEVTFIARNRNLQAINANGFRLINEDGSEQHAPRARRAAHGRRRPAGRGAADREGAPGGRPAARAARPVRPADQRGHDDQRRALVVLPQAGRPVRGPAAGQRRPGRPHRRGHRARAHHRQRGLPGGRTGGAGRGARDRRQPLHAGRTRRQRAASASTRCRRR